MTIDAGDSLGPYQIQSAIGQGGMGIVYRARDTKLGRDVAIKILPEDLVQDADRLGRFRREAQVLASLNHPHIAAIHGLEEVDGRPFLVLELVEGEDLSERLKRGPLPLEEAIAIARQLTEALEQAHAKGIVHRDLKPANIRVTEDGDVKVLDFGLAKAYTGETGEGSASDLSQSPTVAKAGTQAGVILGTAAYMSPEQARGKAIDKRTDIWAFGVVLYEMLTGRALFSGETLSDTLAAILKNDPDWTGIPTLVGRLLRRCLEKNPKNRLHDIADARLEIDEALAGPGATAAPPTRTPRLAWALVALFFVTTVAFGFLYLARATNPAMMSADILPPADTTFFLDPVYPGVPALSPDGTMVTFTAVEPNGARRLYVRSLVEPVTRELPGTDNAAYPFWSPDSRTIGFFADRALKKIMAAGGAPEALSEARNGKGGSWNRNGEIVFAPDASGGLYRISSDGGEAIPITELASDHNSHRHPRFLPDGRHFLFFARSQAGVEHNGVFVGSLDGGEPRLLLRAETAASFAADHLLFVRGGALMARPFDAKQMTLAGDAVPLIEDVHALSGTGAVIASVSETGSLIYQTSGGRDFNHLELLDRHGVPQLDLGELNLFVARNEMGTNFSPDGRYVALGILDANTGTHDLWIYDLSREIRTRFTFEPTEEFLPKFSPDGSRLFFTSNRGDGAEFRIYSKDVAGAGEPELVFEGGEIPIAINWSPDGKLLVVGTTTSASGDDIWIVPLDGSAEPYAFAETRFNESGGFSPDGRFIALTSDESGQNEVYIAPFLTPGRKWQVSTDGGTSPRWSGDGRVIYYREPSGSVVAADIERRDGELEVSSVAPLFALPNQSSAWWPSPDGSRFLIARAGEQESRPLTLIVNWPEMLRPQ